MKKLCTILSVFFVLSIQAEIYTCYYNGDDFHVIQNGLKKSYYAHDGFSQASLGCSKNIAAIYDGDDLVIFDNEESEFKRVFVNSRFLDSKMVVTDTLLGFYDGNEFFIYSFETKSISRHNADDYQDNAQMTYFNDGIAFYDGDDLIIFDQTDQSFYYQYVDNLRSHFQLINAGHGVLFYDGDEVISYCKKNFTTKDAKNDFPVQVLGRKKETRALVIDEDIYLLNNQCDLLIINGFE